MYKFSLILFGSLIFFSFTSFNIDIGQPIDSFNGVTVYYNGMDFKHVAGRNVTEDGYNLGLKYQCVEFVKRYYYEVYGHKMPNSYGHAKDFFDDSLGDVGFNEARGLWQYRNTRYEKPKVGDILVYGASPSNPFGHAGILCKVEDDHVVMIQQNFGKKTRQRLALAEYRGIYTVADYDVLGWLRYGR